MKISIIGCGKMGSRLAQGLSKEHTLHLFDHNSKRASSLAKDLKAHAFKTAQEATQKADIVILAVRPQNLREVSSQLKGHLQKHQLVVSVMAGITIQTLNHAFAPAIVVRAMPNLPVAYGCGAIALTSYSKNKKKIEESLAPLGFLYWIPEEKMDAATALSGSGPAFVAVMIEAMTEAGVSMGFTAQESLEIVLSTMRGTVDMLQKSGLHPASLKWQVASPGGTTISGLRRLEDEKVRGGIIETVLAAFNKSQNMKD